MAHRLQNERRHLSYLQQRLPQPQVTINQQMQKLDRLQQQLKRNYLHVLNDKRQQLDYWSVRLKHPQEKIEIQHYKIATLTGRLQQVVQKKLEREQAQHKDLKQRLQLKMPLPMIDHQQAIVRQLQKQLDTAMQKQLTQYKANLGQQVRTLAAVSPLNTLERGYSIATLVDSGRVLHRADEAKPNQHINVRLGKGQLVCEIKEVKND